MVKLESVLNEEELMEVRRRAALKIQTLMRARQAFKHAGSKAELKKQRSMIPMLDEHGHANPATIRYFNGFPMVHSHHHGLS